MPTPKDREPSEPTHLSDLVDVGDFPRSALGRLVTHMAVRLADPDTPEAEMRLIRLVRKALDEIAEKMTPPD